MAEFRNYKKFIDIEETKPFSDLLTVKNISFRIVETAPAIDITFAGNIRPEFWLQIQSVDFENVDILIEKELFSGEIEPNHYLYEFSDTELTEIFEKFDEWSKSDFILAKKILKNRGKDISENEIRILRKNRIAELEKPEKMKALWITAGYIFALMGGFIAVVIGISVSKAKKTLPDGRKVFTYDKKSRLHAKYILFLGIVFLTIGLIYNYINY